MYQERSELQADSASDNNQFDYIIVGAGSAGCIMAECLSQNGKYRVAVVEAGGSDRKFWPQLPLGYGKTFYDRRVNWGYETAHDPGLGGRRDYWPRGKLLGGSGSINAMVWIRGHEIDYNGWAAEGNHGWGWGDVKPWFEKLEHHVTMADKPRLFVDSPIMSALVGQHPKGKIPISDVSSRVHVLTQRYLAAGKQAGLAVNTDFNGASQLGVGVYRFNLHRGWRVSSAKAFLRPALARPNVTLFKRSLVKEITFASQTDLNGKAKATGIIVQSLNHADLPDARPFHLTARREVILSAGAVATPQLLQISGIGPGEVVQSIGRHIRRELPAVGHYLQDHLGINYSYRATIPSLNQELRSLAGKIRAGMEYFTQGSGPLSMSLNQAGGFIATRPDLAAPNIQLYFQALSTVTAKSGTRPLTTPDDFAGFSIGLSNCRTTSRGSILAQSPDMQVPPYIQANALATASDRQDVIEGLHWLRRIAAQPALTEIISEELRPGPAVQGDEAMLADFMARAGTVYHPCGTARMGVTPDHSAVDGNLSVHGVANLRVVDASVFPSVPTGNTNAPVMMVAMKAAASMKH
ncbi:MAG: GMC family oxidoreductase N-terminal domain-containing protein [Alphaproteobacteria bacterium]|nr:GMC family oxidoreductase N-terminal domain-containing protein [Alphaproteobacteria bacterium]